MNKENWGAHETNCCVLHGCKYGDEDCPVTLNKMGQADLCEDCKDQSLSFRQLKDFSLREKIEKQNGIKLEVVIFRDDEKMDHFKVFHEKLDKFLKENNYLLMGITGTQGDSSNFKEEE